MSSILLTLLASKISSLSFSSVAVNQSNCFAQSHPLISSGSVNHLMLIPQFFCYSNIYESCSSLSLRPTLCHLRYNVVVDNAFHIPNEFPQLLILSYLLTWWMLNQRTGYHISPCYPGKMYQNMWKSQRHNIPLR